MSHRTYIIRAVRILVIGPLCGVAAFGSIARSQAASASGFVDTRAWLEARAAAAERTADTASSVAVRVNETARADAMRKRLREGDFLPGDRVWVAWRLDSVVADTFTVRGGRRLLLPDFPEIDLSGVLRAELAGYLNAQLSRFVRDPQVRAVALMRVGVLGELTRPGYFWLRSDALLSDALSQAGGPTGQADVARIAIRRDGRDLLTPASAHEALQQGATLAALGVQSGDEIVINARPQHNWTMIISTAAVSLGVITTMLATIRR